MPFDFQPARAPLAGTVRAFWAFREAPGEGAREPERIVPDGCTEIVVHFGDPFTEGGALAPQPRAIFAGQITAPLWLRPGAAIDVVGVRFEPGGARRLGLPPQSHLADLRIAFEDLLAPPLRTLWSETTDRMAHAAGFPARVRLLERFLSRALRREPVDGIDACVRSIESGGGALSLDRAATLASLSTRQMQRRFLADVGMSPKLFARVVRFQRVFDRWHEGDENWSGIALACGYYDQAHLLRDFRQFAGEPPSAFLAALAPLSGAFLERR
jgi:AraC-like DNA-binding protein